MKGTTRSSHPPTASLHDKDVPPVVAQVWADVAAVSRNLVENLKRERAIIHEYFLQQERQIAHNQSRFVDLECADRYADDPSFFLWNPDRSLNRQDFDYLHHHRKRFVPPVRELLEIVNAKITAQTAEGEPRYFNKLETNIGWTPHIVPIIFALHNRFSLEPSRLPD